MTDELTMRVMTPKDPPTLELRYGGICAEAAQCEICRNAFRPRECRRSLTRQSNRVMNAALADTRRELRG
jgi:hypothetical protein